MSGVSFVSETEIDEIRDRRQKEWEKVRKEDDPLGKSGLSFPRSCMKNSNVNNNRVQYFKFNSRRLFC